MKSLFGGLAIVGLLVSSLATDPAAAQRKAPSKVHGVTLSTNAHNLSQKGAEHERLKSVGMNTVSLTVWWSANEALSTIQPDRFTEPDAELEEAVDAAHAAGLSVALMPMFHCNSCKLSTWRGHVNPLDRDAFYDDYVRYIERYAAFAEEQGVELLFLGSELTSLQGDTAQWRRIAAAARAVYSGELIYEVNWDAIGGVQFWDAVDVPAISAYFPLTEAARPSVDELNAAWRSGKQKLSMGVDAFATVQDLAKRTGKQVLFGEAGYRSREFAARQPFDSVSTNGSASEEVQANAYQSLLETFDGQPWWRGVLWWIWEVEEIPDPAGFSPRDNEAELVLKRWLVDGVRRGAKAAPGATPSTPGRPRTNRPPSSNPTATTAAGPKTSLAGSGAADDGPTARPGRTTTSEDRSQDELEVAAPEDGSPRGDGTHPAGAAAGVAALAAAVAGLSGYSRVRVRSGTERRGRARKR